MPASEYQPQLATLVRDAPTGDGWLHEIKYDGYRIGCRVRGKRVALYSRNGKEWTAAFPEIVTAVRELGIEDALFDGEVAMVLPDGRTSFQALQNAGSSTSRRSLAFFVFDLLRVDGKRIEQRPLEERKERLRALLGRRGKSGAVRYSEHVIGDGDAFFDRACRLGLEGIISKRRDQPYRHGRHPDWLKTKCIRRQEFVIGGFTDPEGARLGIGALLIGYYDHGRLVFAGKVGTGFSHKTAIDLRRRLAKIEQPAPPFTQPPTGASVRRAHWVDPTLVAEVTFTEWTEEGKIRHPSFQGLREDKPARAIKKEEPVAAPPSRQASTGRSAFAVVQGVRISHPDRIVYPKPGLTKLDVARYYESIGKWIAPHVAGRPLTLVRCPEGMRGECFYMKHSKVWAPPALRRVRIQEKTKLGEYLIADSVAAVISLAQMGVLEIHTWNADFDRIEQPNRLVFDLDPGERVTWPDVIDAARVVRSALRALGLESWVKTTGGRGLHVVVPLIPAADWSMCLEFSRALAEQIEANAPDSYTTNFAKAGRATKILIDYLRNNRTNTSVAAYSTRANEAATVSMPLAWRELTRTLDPATFTVLTTPHRLAKLKKDPWADYSKAKQRLTRAAVKALHG